MADITEIVDMTSTAHHMKIFDTLNNTNSSVTVIDVRAALLSPALARASWCCWITPNSAFTQLNSSLRRFAIASTSGTVRRYPRSSAP